MQTRSTASANSIVSACKSSSQRPSVGRSTTILRESASVTSASSIRLARLDSFYSRPISTRFSRIAPGPSLHASPRERPVRPTGSASTVSIATRGKTINAPERVAPTPSRVRLARAARAARTTSSAVATTAARRSPRPETLAMTFATARACASATALARRTSGATRASDSAGPGCSRVRPAATSGVTPPTRPSAPSTFGVTRSAAAAPAPAAPRGRRRALQRRVLGVRRRPALFGLRGLRRRPEARHVHRACAERGSVHLERRLPSRAHLHRAEVHASGQRPRARATTRTTALRALVPEISSAPTRRTPGALQRGRARLRLQPLHRRHVRVPRSSGRSLCLARRLRDRSVRRGPLLRLVGVQRARVSPPSGHPGSRAAAHSARRNAST